MHHGGAGTTAAGLRAGVPASILWMARCSGDVGSRGRTGGELVGCSRRFSDRHREDRWPRTCVTILSPQHVARARELATAMTKPSESVAAAADHVEDFARLRRVG